MATTRELAEAYGYDSRRRVTSLVRGTDEARHDPRRRLNRSFGAGVAIGVLILSGFGIAGWLGGGSGPDLPDNGAVTVSDSGDRYVVSDGVVHPALNLASALLVGGGDVTEVRQAALNEAPRGLPIGIPGAPDALPGEDDLLDGDWTLCATPAETGGQPVGTALYVSVPGTAPPAGARDEEARTILAQTEDDALWLLTEGRRYSLTAEVADLVGLQHVRPVQLPAGMVATLPEGPSIGIPEADATGRPPAADMPFDAEVGDVARSEGSGARPQYYQVRDDGLVAVTPLVHTLLSAEVADHEIAVGDAASAPRSSAPAPGDRAWPAALPVADEPGRNEPVCVSTPPGAPPGDAPWQVTVHLPGTMPEPEGLAPVAAEDPDRLGMLDAVYVPAGAGAVVRAAPSAAAGGTHTLITDGGTAYPFASAEAVERLRYSPADAPAVPAAFVGLLPTGPPLDPDAAARELGDPAGSAVDAEDAAGTPAAAGPADVADAVRETALGGPPPVGSHAVGHTALASPPPDARRNEVGEDRTSRDGVPAARVDPTGDAV